MEIDYKITFECSDGWGKVAAVCDPLTTLSKPLKSDYIHESVIKCLENTYTQLLHINSYGGSI